MEKGSQLDKVRKIEQKGIYFIFVIIIYLGRLNSMDKKKVTFDDIARYTNFSKTTISRWEYLPVAMAPDESYDAGGCYSGSAIEADGEHVLVYTGVIDRGLENLPRCFLWEDLNL